MKALKFGLLPKLWDEKISKQDSVDFLFSYVSTYLKEEVAAEQLVVALAGTTVAMLTSGLLAGVTYGAAAGDIGGKLALVLGSAAVQLPAVWLLVAVTTVLFGAVPRFTATCGRPAGTKR